MGRGILILTTPTHTKTAMNNLRAYLPILWFCLLSLCLSAQDGYEIEVQLDSFALDTVVLASYYGKSNTVIDTFTRDKKGTFRLQGDEALNGGIYLLILPPKNEFFEFVVDKDQQFRLHCNIKDAVGTMKTKGSAENKLYFEYRRFMLDKSKEAETLAKQLEKAADDAAKEQIQGKRDALDDEVTQYFDKMQEQYPHHIISLMVNASKPPVRIPDHLKDADDLQRYYYYKKHYFDNLDLGDERLLRTNFLFKRVEYYMEKLTPQHPDSLATSVDYLLARMKKDGDMYRYYLSHFLNEYANSKIVGMDAVYVHIAKKYYLSGQAPWVDGELLEKIGKSASEIEPTLIGQPAPDAKLRRKDGSTLNIRDIESKYVVLYFWDPDCGHCKKSSPDMIAFHDKFKNKGVQLVGICTEIRDEVKKCWETIDERGYEWMNLVDPFLQSRYKTKYNIKSTPQIFILDKDKKIIMKRIGADQLSDVMDKIIEREQEELNEKQRQ